MSLDQLPRHQQRFKIDIVGVRKHRAQTQQQGQTPQHPSRFIFGVSCAHRFAASA